MALDVIWAAYSPSLAVAVDLMSGAGLTGWRRTYDVGEISDKGRRIEGPLVRRVVVGRFRFFPELQCAEVLHAHNRASSR